MTQLKLLGSDILQGRQRVGRVVPHAQGGYFARIEAKPAFEARASTAKEAFHQVCAKAFGFSSPEALRQHNHQVRESNAALRAALRGRF